MGKVGSGISYKKQPDASHPAYFLTEFIGFALFGCEACYSVREISWNYIFTTDNFSFRSSFLFTLAVNIKVDYLFSIIDCYFSAFYGFSGNWGFEIYINILFDIFFDSSITRSKSKCVSLNF